MEREKYRRLVKLTTGRSFRDIKSSWLEHATPKQRLMFRMDELEESSLKKRIGWLEDAPASTQIRA